MTVLPEGLHREAGNLSGLTRPEKTKAALAGGSGTFIIWSSAVNKNPHFHAKATPQRPATRTSAVKCRGAKTDLTDQSWG
jgi:hypothetical protein